MRGAVAVLAALLALRPTLLAADARQDAPAGAAPAGAAPIDGDPVAAARGARLAADRLALERELAAIRAFGQQETFRSALQRIRDDANGRRWWPVGEPTDGAISLVTVEQWLDWSAARPERAVPWALEIAAETHPGVAIVDLARQLNAHGIEFVYVSFPTRIELHPELIAPAIAAAMEPAAAAGDGAAAAPFRGMGEANARFLLELVGAGVEVVNLAPDFVQQRDLGDAEEHARRRLLYHRWNMHWTPRAIELAAERIGERLAAQPWYRPGPYKEGKAFTLRRKAFDFTAEGNGQAPDSLPEPIALNAVHMSGAPLKKETKQASPIVLLGDSFANMHKDYGAAIHDHLFRVTGWPIDVIAPPGGAELQCRETLRRRGDGLAGKKVVIWLMQDAALLASPQFRPVALFEK
ncbi:MAG: hypothetical protein FJ293_05460 [Planctomycetes bacterium]|nr:hypothetical protein [Planctomycetota bacterium]